MNGKRKIVDNKKILCLVKKPKDEYKVWIPPPNTWTAVLNIRIDLKDKILIKDMTNQEILDYNQRCAEFLGAYWCNDDLETFPNGYWMYDDDNDIDLPFNLEDMMFHLDWNWIMEIIESIEKLEFRFEIAYNQVDLECIQPDLNRFSYHVNLSDCVGYGEDLELTKKDAVVKAINQFLIWYQNLLWQ